MSLSLDAIRSIPKVDLHRHLEGSIRPETFLEIARTRRVPLPTYDLDALRPMIQVMGDRPSFPGFLSKFDLFDGFWPDREAIERVACEAVEDAARDGVVYLELRYAPAHFARGRSFDPAHVIEWVTAAGRRAAAAHGIRVEFIATAGRHRPMSVNSPALEAVLAAGRERFVGLDVAGDETRYPLTPFAPYLERARKAGLGITLHAGEAGPPSHVEEAIFRYGADRVGHGVRIADAPDLIAAARDRRIGFEMCLTSNVQTGAVPSLKRHPARALLHQGLCVTLNTDDPHISGTDLALEWQIALSEAGFVTSDLAQVTQNAVETCFLPAAEKADLARRLGQGVPAT